MDLGLFSISLAVDDLAASRAFYEKLGFEVTGGDEERNYLIMVNGTTVIGLFEGMFEKNILTFNPGLALDGEEGKQLDEFTDVREIQAALRERGIELIETADEDSEGAAHITFEDPDGNPILIDQFF
ncbi:MAG: VOC family protein [Gemmatimonadota bacterium]